MIPNKSLWRLEEGLSFEIKNAWVESSWSYECIDNKAVIKKDSFQQFVLEVVYNGDMKDSNYFLMQSDMSQGAHLGAILVFSYAGQDTFNLILTKVVNSDYNQPTIIDSFVFVKKDRNYSLHPSSVLGGSSRFFCGRHADIKVPN